MLGWQELKKATGAHSITQSRTAYMALHKSTILKWEKVIIDFFFKRCGSTDNFANQNLEMEAESKPGLKVKFIQFI